MNKHMLAGVATATAMSLLAAAAAQATVVSFTLNSPDGPAAIGAFEYTTGATGTLGFADLSNFRFEVEGSGVTYHLHSALPNYAYFAFDTAAGAFVTGVGHGAAGDYAETLGAINGDYTKGYFVGLVPGGVDEYSTGTSNAFSNITYTEISSFGAVPEPATWAMMLVGVAGIGALIRRRAGKLAAA